MAQRLKFIVIVTDPKRRKEFERSAFATREEAEAYAATMRQQGLETNIVNTVDQRTASPAVTRAACDATP